MDIVKDINKNAENINNLYLYNLILPPVYVAIVSRAEYIRQHDAIVWQRGSIPG